MRPSTADKHLRTQLRELQHRYNSLTERIAAIDSDLDRELDNERKLVLQERRAERDRERNQIAVEIDRIESALSSPISTNTEAEIENNLTVGGSSAQGPNLPGVAIAQHHSDQTGSARLEVRIEAQVREGRITEDERDILLGLYRQSLTPIDTPRKSTNPDWTLDRPDIQDGEAQMTAQDSHVVNLAESLFLRTGHSLAQDLAQVVEYHSVWPELIVGDAITDKSIQVLNDMQKRMAIAGRIAAQHVAPSAKRRFQMEHDGMMSSANKLVGVLEESSSHLVRGRMPWNTIELLEQQLDELVYYTNRCLLWLNDLAQSTRHAGIVQ